jgi:hypothetical protein
MAAAMAATPLSFRRWGEAVRFFSCLVGCLLAGAGAALATVPPYDPNFKPASHSYTGPIQIGFSGFCLSLERGETATRDQLATWANRTKAMLKSGTLEIAENGGGGYGPDPGQIVRRVRGAVIKRHREQGRLVYYFDDGLPGTTVITYLSERGSQKIDPILGRFGFGDRCS